MILYVNVPGRLFREEIEKQKAKERYMKMHLAGKTDQAKADLARLAIIRKQREDAAKKKEEERKGKLKGHLFSNDLAYCVKLIAYETLIVISSFLSLLSIQFCYSERSGASGNERISYTVSEMMSFKELQYKNIYMKRLFSRTGLIVIVLPFVRSYNATFH